MQRPTSVTIFGILNIVFGIFGVLGMIGSVAMFAFMEDSNNPAITVMRNNPGYAAWIKLNIPLGLLSCALLIAAGIGMLKLKEWARKMSIGYAIYAIVVGIIGIVLNYFFLIRPMLEEASHQSGPAAAGAIGGAIGGSLGGFFSLVYPVLLLVFMLRPNVVAAFRSNRPTLLPG